MRRMAVVLIVLAFVAGAALADYVQLDNYVYAGGDDWDFHYTYYREAGSSLQVGGTWELTGVSGVYYCSGPVYWDNGTVSENGTRVVWAYIGGDSPPNSNYTTFDLTANLPQGHAAPVPYSIDLDGDGTPDSTSDVIGPTPEPGTLGLVLVGVGGIAVRLRRRRR